MPRAARKQSPVVAENSDGTAGKVAPLKPGQELAKPYEPSASEKAAVARYAKRKAAIPNLPQMKVKMVATSENTFDARLSMDHPHRATAYQLVADALNSGDMPFVYGWLKEASGLGIRHDKADMDMEQVNYGIAVAVGIKPRDTVEAMLALQMAAVHMASMKAASHLMSTNNLKARAMYESSVNKLGRTFTTQMEALKRYRSKRSQRIVVERVNVSEGGQAIVGDVHTGKRGEVE